MGYSTVEDLKKLIDEQTLTALTDDEGSGSVNIERVNEAIDIADREIDAYLSGKFSVPFAEPPEIIKNISAQMAIYHLFSRKTEDYPKVWADKYENCLKLLEKIQGGEILLGDNSLSKSSVKYISKTRYFTFENLKN